MPVDTEHLVDAFLLVVGLAGLADVDHVAVDTAFELMGIRPQSEGSFELAKTSLGFEQRHVGLPELRGSETLVSF